MNHFGIETLRDRLEASTESYLEFVQSKDLSAGIYRLAAGDTDPQDPHTEDELYYVVSGKAQLRAAGEDREVGPGSIVFVEARKEHRFHSIDEDLLVLVVFGPAEYSRQGSGDSGSS